MVSAAVAAGMQSGGDQRARKEDEMSAGTTPARAIALDEDESRTFER